MRFLLRYEDGSCNQWMRSYSSPARLKFSNFLVVLLAFLLIFSADSVKAQGTWTKITAQAPHQNGGGMLLLSDGTVLAKSFAGSGSYGDLYDRLTPDSTGSYVHGTWATIAAMNDSRLYYSSQVLMDGRVYVAGGEYGTGTSKAETYDPLTNVWTAAPNPGGTISDANSEILPDGKVLQAEVTGNLKKTKIYDPQTNTYIDGPSCLGKHNESTWVKLKDSSILMVDRGTTSSERYIPSLNKWVADADVPVDLYDGILETGAALLLPDGRVWHIGSTGHTAYYTPSGDTLPGTWVAGPDVPDGNGQDDGPSAIMPDGKILLAVAPKGGFNMPTSFYEFDYLTDSYTSLTCPDGEPTNNIPCYVTGMVLLPTGQVLVTFQDSTNYYVYTPSGEPVSGATPTITGLTENGCSNSYTLTGMLFNGISEGAAYGDDWQMASNYPIVQLSLGTKVWYGRTYNWNSTGVMRGSLPDTTQLSLPADLPVGIYSLVVIANGFASDPILFSPLSAAIAANGVTIFCEGGSVTLTANDGIGFSYQWEKDGLPVLGETNSIYTAGQSGDYTVVVSNQWGCDTVSNVVSVVVNPLPDVTASALDTSICEGSSTILSAEGAETYSWQPGNLSGQDVSVNPTATTSYEVTGTDVNGCSNTAQVSVTVNPIPVISLGNDTTVCDTSEFTLNAGSGFSSYEWSTGATTQTISVTSSGMYIASVTDPNGCSGSDTIQVQVTICSGIFAVTTSTTAMDIFPNPNSGNFMINLSTGNTILNGDAIIQILSPFGQKVYEEKLSVVNGKLQQEISLDKSAAGMYLVKVTINGEESMKEVIVSQ